MLRKLRIKFIVLIMVVVACVLTVAFTTICVIDYQQNVEEVYSTLNGAISQAGEKAKTNMSFRAQLPGSDNNGSNSTSDNSGSNAANADSSSGDSTTNNSNSQTNPGEAAANRDAINEIANGSQAEDGSSNDASNSDDASSDGAGSATSTSNNGTGSNSPASTGSDSTTSTKPSPSTSSTNNSPTPSNTKPSSTSATSDSGGIEMLDEASKNTSSYAPPEIGGSGSTKRTFLPAAVYSEEDDGSLSAVSGSNTASIADDVLAQASAEIQGKKAGRGELKSLGLIYVKRSVGNTTYVAFADTSSVNGWQSLALTLLAVGVIALLVFFLISVLFSRWALKPVQQAWAQQKQFVADASHDLKTPLTVILANTSILMEHPEHSIESESQWLESTQHEALGMQSLVGDLLTLAQLDEEEAAGSMGKHAGALPVPKERIDFSDLMEGEMLQFESVAFENAIELNSNLTPNIFVMGNQQRLRRLAVTLVDNACKYAGMGGIVNVTLTKESKRAVLSVNNTGPVISAEDLPHIFDRFYRADKSRTTNAEETGQESSEQSPVGGHGLGLAIAHAIAEEHGGSLSAASNQSDGTTFTASLPLA